MLQISAPKIPHDFYLEDSGKYDPGLSGVVPYLRLGLSDLSSI